MHVDSYKRGEKCSSGAEGESNVEEEGQCILEHEIMGREDGIGRQAIRDVPLSYLSNILKDNDTVVVENVISDVKSAGSSQEGERRAISSGMLSYYEVTELWIVS